MLAPGPSTSLRDQLVGELQQLGDGEDLAQWAHQRLPAKNSLAAEDARAIEDAYQKLLDPMKLQEEPAKIRVDTEPHIAPPPR